MLGGKLCFNMLEHILIELCNFCRIQNFCGSMADSVTSDNNILHIRYFAEAAAIESTFEILYTAFRDKSTTPGGNETISSLLMI